MDKLELKPLEGINDIKFGLNEKTILEYFGEPEEKEELDPIEDYITVLWHYWDIGVTVFFDKRKELVFTSIEVDNVDAELWGHRIFDMGEEELKKIFTSKGYSDIDIEITENNEKRVSFDDAMVDLYFEEGQLTGISYGIFIDDDITMLN